MFGLTDEQDAEAANDVDWEDGREGEEEAFAVGIELARTR